MDFEKKWKKNKYIKRINEIKNINKNIVIWRKNKKKGLKIKKNKIFSLKLIKNGK